MHNIIERRSAHSGRLERWVGAERLEQVSKNMKGWPGPPIHILDCPGNVQAGGDGDFTGPFRHGMFMAAADAFADRLRRTVRAIVRGPRPGFAGAGYASMSDALSRASGGFSQLLNGGISKSGPTGVVNSAHSLWRVGAMPAAGGAGAAPPGGTAHVKSDTGAMAFTNPAAGTLRLHGADFWATVALNTLLLYDRLFSVAKTINSTATESVTGVPTRYQSSTATSEEYAGGNFLFMEVAQTAYANTAHNWTVCRYRNQAGTDTISVPSLAGNPGGVATIADRLDMPINTFFAPLASGDSGVMDLDQMQCSALVATGVLNFVIGHPIGFMLFPFAASTIPFDWLTNRNQTPYISNNACLALLELAKPATTATNYGGHIYVCSTAS